MRLCEEGEELTTLQSMQPEQILVRWVNFHLKKEGVERRINNLGKDLADSVAYIHLFHSLDSSTDKSALSNEDLNTRASHVLVCANNLHVPDTLRSEDIVSGNSKLNTLFVAAIFNTKHGLEELTQEEYEKAKIIYDDIEGTKEERQFRLWINSLGIEDVFVTNLYEEAKDGLLLLKVIHKIDDTVVDWKKVEKNPNNRFKMGINCTQAIDAAKKLKLVTTGIGGTDILDGVKKNIIAVVWQLVKLHYLRIIGSKTEDDLIKWANEVVKDGEIKNFKDKTLADGRFLIKLCAAIEPRAVDWDLVMPGETEEEKENNAKYAISLARKFGCIIFCVWDDILNVNYKMILVLICSLFETYKEKKGE